VTGAGRARRRLATGSLVVVSSYLGVRSRRTDRMDAMAERTITARHHPRVDRVLGLATDLGSIHALGGVTAVLAATGRRRAAVEIAGAGALAWVLAQAVKPAARRRRPYEAGRLDLLVSPPAGSSWPSGHAALAAATATAVWSRLTPRGRLVAGATVTGVGVSRIYVGVHHASDIAAGVGVGIVSAGAVEAIRGAVSRR
jgi:membrane-associated phospholipid phosphatase